MPSIESSGFPIVFKVREPSVAAPSASLQITTEVRSLAGMQKEAIVTSRPDGACWRLACDEGPYLEGKDLAPFPLGFFAAGMQFCYLSQFLQGARALGISLDAVSLDQDNFYTMEGSFLRGDAAGGAEPSELRLKVRSPADASSIAELARRAEAGSPTQSLMRRVLRNTFAVHLNGSKLDLPGLEASPPPAATDPAARFETLAPGSATFAPEIITRVKKGLAVHGVEGGAGSSLKAEQKRRLHIRGEARWVRDMLMETVIHLHQPIGSSFRFLCDDTVANGGHAEAPPPLAYVSAGVGFCYMTQLGRYARIAKHPLAAYRIVQTSSFLFDGSLDDGNRRGEIGPVDTQVFLDATYADEGDAPKLVAMGEQTCFLHAAMRGTYPSRITVESNGDELRG